MFLQIHPTLPPLRTSQALPLVNIVFGKLAQDFNDYFLPNATVTESRFKAAVNKNTYVLRVSLFSWQWLTVVGCFFYTYSSESLH